MSTPLENASKYQDKIEKVMGEWKSGDLKSSSGQDVKDRSQAVAIALSEAERNTKKENV